MRRLPLRSPPRMRGKAKNRCRSCPLTRITPAYAGKSLRIPRCATRWREHPRACGEKYQPRVTLRTAAGSPPRMRGKGVKHGNSGVRVGITPAYAGKRAWRTCRTARTWDHPRVCGEKCISGICKKCRSGSPPRVRGKGSKNVPKKRSMGITPAYAGKRTFVPLVKSTA